MSIHSKYPEAFLNRMQNQLGAEFDAFLQSLDEPSPTSVRLNPFKTANKPLFEGEEQIPWCANGKYLKERPSFTFDPLFHAGAYYVQEPSSMFVEQAWKQINPSGPVKVLDMCAAPGGKSTHLLSLINNNGLLVSNEIIPNRNKILQQNIVKWGSPNCIVTQNKPEDFEALPDFFDIILVDAPCSGEGLFRKDKEAIDEWSEKNVELCSVRQRDILKHAITCLKPGGFLIYSTCTFEPGENDEQISNCGLRIADFKIPTTVSGISKTKYGYQFHPHKVKGEGFFIALLQKEESEGEQLSTKPIPQSKIRNPQFLNNPGNYIEHIKDDLVFAIPQNLLSEFSLLSKNFYIRHAGIFMGTAKGKDFLPSHDLALSTELRNDLPSIELNYDDAIMFLRGETPKLNTTHRGWCLVKFEGLNLGCIKALDGRINNYYPKELRILKR